MKKTINESEFIDEFKGWDTYKDNFSRSGLRALYDYLVEYEESTGQELELDIVSICCEFSEYASAWEAMQEYQPDDMPTVEDSEGMDLLEIQEKQEALALEWLQERTTVIEFDGTIALSDGKVMGDMGVIIAKF